MPGPLEDLPLVVRLGVGDLVARRERLHLILAVCRAVRIGERAERDAEGVAVAADLPVNLKAPLQLRLIVRAEHAAETPVLARRLGLLRLVLGEGEPAQKQSENCRGKGGGFEADHRCLPLGSVAVQAWAAAAASGFLASTASAIEAGIGFVFSVKLSNGMMTRKKPK